MGRSALIVVVLMSTIYAGIMIKLQSNLQDISFIIGRNMITKEAESVSDYALRTAVRNSVMYGLQAQVDAFTSMTIPYTGFNVGNCVIDSIKYTFVSAANRYIAKTYVRGSMFGMQISYPAEIAFNFPLSGLSLLPTCFYLEMDQPQFNPSFNRVYDSSPNGNDGFFHGAISTRPNGSGVNGWKCASFESGGGWIDFPGNASTEVSANFSIVCFAKIRQGHANATLVWLPSNPYDTNVAGSGNPGQNLRYKPTGGIYFSGGNMHFTATTLGYHDVTVSVPFTPDGKWPHNKDQWHFFGLTFNNGTVKAYINGVLRGTASAPGLQRALTNTYGFTLGRKDIRVLGPGGSSEYMYMYGLMDQVGLYNITLTDAQMYNFYQGVINPADILYIKD